MLQSLFIFPAYFLYTMVKKPDILAESCYIGLAETILTSAVIKYLGD